MLGDGGLGDNSTSLAGAAAVQDAGKKKEKDKEAVDPGGCVCVFTGAINSKSSSAVSGARDKVCRCYNINRSIYLQYQ